MAMRLLLVLNLLLGGALGLLWFDDTAQPLTFKWQAPSPITPELSVVSDSSGAAAANPAQYLAILDRPLFAPDRLPPPPPEVLAPPPPPPPDPFASFQPLGIFSGAENAGVLASIEGKVRRLKLSDTVGDWALKSIDGRDITFARGDETRVIRLLHAKLGAPPKVQPVGAPVASAVQPGAAQVDDVQAEIQRRQEYVRENIRKRNEIRIKAGLPPIND